VSDFNVGINIDLFEERDKLRSENEALKARIMRLEIALFRIANQDYRGNRSTESQIAFEALKEANP
jgi:hypothetical protein